MNTVSVRRTVNASPERTFAVFSNVAAAEHYLSAVTRVEVLSDGPTGAGTRWRETRVMMGREATEEMWIETFDPPRAYSVAAESAGTRYLTTFTFAPDGSGTEVEMAFTGTPVTLLARVLGAIMAPMMMGAMRKALAQDMDDLKAVAEAAEAAEAAGASRARPPHEAGGSVAAPEDISNAAPVAP